MWHVIYANQKKTYAQSQMKKCVMCEEEAVFSIKGTSDFYCKCCAEESFSSLDLLEKIN